MPTNYYRSLTYTVTDISRNFGFKRNKHARHVKSHIFKPVVTCGLNTRFDTDLQQYSIYFGIYLELLINAHTFPLATTRDATGIRTITRSLALALRLYTDTTTTVFSNAVDAEYLIKTATRVRDRHIHRHA